MYYVVLTGISLKSRQKVDFPPYILYRFIISAQRLGSYINFLSQNSGITHLKETMFLKENSDIIYVEITYQLSTRLMS